MGLTMGQRKAVTKANATRYKRAGKAEKSKILDELCATTGWHRSHARKALAAALRPRLVSAPRRPRAPVCGPDVLAALQFCWAVLGAPTGKRLAPTTVGCGQGELSDAWRHHALFTDTPDAHARRRSRPPRRRDHRTSPRRPQSRTPGPPALRAVQRKRRLAGACLVVAAIAFNLTRAVGTLASTFHAKATTATIRTQLIAVPARLAYSARRLVLHLPVDWPWEQACQDLNDAVRQATPQAA
jgi:hypothetical protein